MYLNPEKMASGAYCCPQSVPVDGFFEISDELTEVLVENKGFVIITVEGNIVTKVTPDADALAAWEESQAGIHQPCEPYGPCNGHGFVATVCPDCKTPQISDIPVGLVSRIASDSYTGDGSNKARTLTFNFPVKFISIICKSDNALYIIHPQEGVGVALPKNGTDGWPRIAAFDVTTQGNTVTIEPIVSSYADINEKGTEYCYVAFG